VRLMGAAAPCAQPLTDELAEALHAGRPALLWCDGQDVTLLVGEDADQADNVLKLGRQVLPELA
jgi:hypothetical protein